MADSKELKAIKEASKKLIEELRNDPVKLKKFIRDINGPETRTLTGQERDHMITVFNLIEPIESSNNQRVWTDVYEHAGKIYNVHFFENDTVIEEVLPDDIQQD